MARMKLWSIFPTVEYFYQIEIKVLPLSETAHAQFLLLMLSTSVSRSLDQRSFPWHQCATLSQPMVPNLLLFLSCTCRTQSVRVQVVWPVNTFFPDNYATKKAIKGQGKQKTIFFGFEQLFVAAENVCAKWSAHLFMQKALTAFQSMPAGSSMVVTVGNRIAWKRGHKKEDIPSGLIHPIPARTESEELRYTRCSFHAVYRSRKQESCGDGENNLHKFLSQSLSQSSTIEEVAVVTDGAEFQVAGTRCGEEGVEAGKRSIQCGSRCAKGSLEPPHRWRFKCALRNTHWIFYEEFQAHFFESFVQCLSGLPMSLPTSLESLKQQTGLTFLLIPTGSVSSEAQVSF